MLPFSKKHNPAFVAWHDHPILLPTDIFAYIFEHYRDKFVENLGGLQSKIHSFWAEHDMNDPKLFNNTIKDISDWMWLCIPILIFGDAAPYTKASKESILVDLRDF